MQVRVQPGRAAVANDSGGRDHGAEAGAYDLHTHCGIDYAQVGNRYYEVTPPLSDGSGNPPPGWGNPYQPGTLTVISPTQAVFADGRPPRHIHPGPIRRPGRTAAPVCS